jgi:hypothetical protein
MMSPPLRLDFLNFNLSYGRTFILDSSQKKDFFPRNQFIPSAALLWKQQGIGEDWNGGGRMVPVVLPFSGAALPLSMRQESRSGDAA